MNKKQTKRIFLLVVVLNRNIRANNAAKAASNSDKRRPVSKQQQGEQHGQQLP
jgi:hypothetical protein